MKMQFFAVTRCPYLMHAIRAGNTFSLAVWTLNGVAMQLAVSICTVSRWIDECCGIEQKNFEIETTFKLCVLSSGKIVIIFELVWITSVVDSYFFFNFSLVGRIMYHFNLLYYRIHIFSAVVVAKNAPSIIDR